MLKRILSHFRSRFFIWNISISFGVSMLAGFFVVTHGHPKPYSVLLFMPGLFASSVYSGIIAFILLFAVYLVSFIGNAKYAGKQQNGRWFIFQLFYGVVLMILLELVLATILFWMMGHWILDTAFFDKIFLLAFMFIAMANLFYLLFFMQRVKVDPEVEYVAVETVRYQSVPTIVAPAVEASSEEIGLQAALFYIHNGEIWKKDFDGEPKIWLTPLSKTMNDLDPKQYFKCSRNWIVHRNAIAQVIPIEGRRLKVICRFQLKIPFIVSRRNAQDFKDWFYQT